MKDCQTFGKDSAELAERLLTVQESGQDAVLQDLDLRQAAFDCGFVELDEEYDILLREVCIRAAKSRISSNDTDDRRIIQAVQALDDIDRNSNELSERLLEWYGAYFPELELTGESLARFVSTFGSRSNVPESHPMFVKASKSMGSELSFADEELLRTFALNLCSLYDTRRHIESYIVTAMGSLAPNLSDTAGALLGARLISMAGSLQKLASFPSSTVQVIGAHRALFKHLRGNTPPPKHGIIFNNVVIKNAPWWQRGKLARSFASKISLAARTDFYTGKRDPSIRESMDKKLNAIRAANPSPPKRESKPAGKPGSRGKSRNKKGGRR
ncbi:rRNA biogenesis protein Nop56/Nop58 [Methanolobus psychrophilus R15]|nr:rRNA biogenesis protein Nop56/Nop58 [Methanolobus psychrophilus R15]